MDEGYDYGLTIFNRLGVLIYHSSDYHNDWDGRGAPAATYYYRFVDGKTGGKYKGWVDVRK